MQSPPEPIEELRRAILRNEYERMVEAGVFDGGRVELLYGVIVRMTPHGPPHDATLDRLTELLVRSAPPHTKVRIQSAFAASGDSEPEPDLAVVPRRDYDDAHPSEAFLVVEVAVSSLSVDRGAKARLYAESGVGEYWVVDVAGRLVEVHTEPTNGRYARITPHRRGDTITIASLEGLVIAVDDFVR
ncbi:MAG: Uma2 family endonuclease [Myxococcota bacterium]|nr:Uma2 family endonuclease [Myxococcota bacterium]